MAAIAFDPMEHIKQLEASGMPRAAYSGDSDHPSRMIPIT